jgi:hypothetical protein
MFARHGELRSAVTGHGRPSRILISRPAAAPIPESCGTRMMVCPSSWFSVFSRCITCPAISLSRLPVGSSAQTIAGRATRARAIV